MASFWEEKQGHQAVTACWGRDGGAGQSNCQSSQIGWIGIRGELSTMLCLLGGWMGWQAELIIKLVGLVRKASVID